MTLTVTDLSFLGPQRRLQLPPRQEACLEARQKRQEVTTRGEVQGRSLDPILADQDQSTTTVGCAQKCHQWRWVFFFFQESSRHHNMLMWCQDDHSYKCTVAWLFTHVVDDSGYRRSVWEEQSERSPSRYYNRGRMGFFFWDFYLLLFYTFVNMYNYY